MKSVTYKANNKTREYSDQNRQNMNLSEVRMWMMLKWSTYIFRRQKTLWNFIVDFASLKHKIVIEVDGITHEHKKPYDDMREQWIIAHGYKMLRFVGMIPFPDDRTYEYVWSKISEIESWADPIVVVKID